MRRLLIHRPNISRLSYGIILYTQDTEYFPGVTSRVMQAPMASYRIIILFYYCIDLDRYIRINNMYTNIYQDGRVRERVVCVCVCLCVCVFVCKYTNKYIKVNGYGTFRFTVHI